MGDARFFNAIAIFYDFNKANLATFPYLTWVSAFLSRPKVVPQNNKAYFTSIKELELKDDETDILKDEIIEVKYTETVEETIIKRTMQLRRIAYYSEKQKAANVYWTNNFKISTQDIISIYQNRWQIE